MLFRSAMETDIMHATVSLSRDYTSAHLREKRMQYSIIAILNALMMPSVAQAHTIIVALPSSPANHFMPLLPEAHSSMTATYIA